MADVAKLSFLPRQLEAMLSCVIHVLFVERLMAANTLAGGHRAVYVTLLGEIAVTRQACLLSGGSRGSRTIGRREPESKADHDEQTFFHLGSMMLVLGPKHISGQCLGFLGGDFEIGHARIEVMLGFLNKTNDPTGSQPFFRLGELRPNARRAGADPMAVIAGLVAKKFFPLLGQRRIDRRVLVGLFV